MHALFLSVERATRWPERLGRIPGGRIVAALCTLTLVLVSWVFFRAENIGQALEIVSQMFDFRTFAWKDIGLLNDRAVAFTVLFMLAEFRFLVRWPAMTPGSLVTQLQPAWTALILVACVYLRGPGGAFIYFQF